MRRELESTAVYCPYCGQIISLQIDCSVEQQIYIEDCSVCCRPITVDVTVAESGMPQVQTRCEDD